MTPALLSGQPVFPKFLPLNSPNLPSFQFLAGPMKEILKSGQVTNGRTVEKFEAAAREYLGVPYVVAVSSATAGLMLVLKAFDLKGEAILPAFTFCATLHSVHWLGLNPVLVDIEPEGYNLDPRRVEEAITKKTAVLIGLHLYGTPCAVRPIEKIAKKHRLPLLFDAAHAFGSRVGATRVGNFGDAEVFSLSPTKAMTSLEGGLITTGDRALYEKLRVLRRYGDPGDYNCIAPGLNARMSEIHALFGLGSLKQLDAELEYRQQYAATMQSRLEGVPGVSWPRLRPGDYSTYKDFTLRIEPEKFGLTRDELAESLMKDNVDHRFYFYPPQHQQKAYPELEKKYRGKLPITDLIAGQVLSLPIYRRLPLSGVKKLAELILANHDHAKEIRAALLKKRRGRK